MVSSIDIHYIVQELQELANCKVDNVYAVGERSFLFQLHCSGKGKVLFRTESDNCWITQSKPALLPVTGFCSKLRRALGGKSIASVNQVESERVIRIDFAELMVYIELFGGGNIILCDTEHKILACLLKREFKDRTIEPGVVYEPPAGKANVFALSAEQFAELLGPRGETVSKALAVQLSIGGAYAAEICARADVDPQKDMLTHTEVKALFDTFQAILAQEHAPRIVLKDELPTMVIPFGFDSLAELEQKPIKSLGEGYDLVHVIPDEDIPIKSSFEAQVKKLENAIAMQKKSIKNLEEKAIGNQRRGELMYEQYQELKQLLDWINEKKETKTWTQIKEVLKQKDIDLDEKTKEITLDL